MVVSNFCTRDFSASQTKNICLFFIGRSRTWKKHGFMEIPITELIFIQPSIMLTNYTAFHHADHFVLTRFAISPRKIFNRPKKKKTKKNFKHLQLIDSRQKRQQIEWYTKFMIHAGEYGTDIAREFCCWLILFYRIFFSGKENTVSLFK